MQVTQLGWNHNARSNYANEVQATVQLAATRNVR